MARAVLLKTTRPTIRSRWDASAVLAWAVSPMCLPSSRMVMLPSAISSGWIGARPSTTAGSSSPLPGVNASRCTARPSMRESGGWVTAPAKAATAGLAVSLRAACSAAWGSAKPPTFTSQVTP
jgi:hypothetical protein